MHNETCSLRDASVDQKLTDGMKFFAAGHQPDLFAVSTYGPDLRL
jgi:hypothetical protein